MEEENVKEEVVRIFLEKVEAKIEKGEEPAKIIDDMEEALNGVLYNTFRIAKRWKEIRTERDVKDILDAMRKTCLKDREGFEIIDKLKKSGRRKEESVRAWGTRIEGEMGKMDPEGKGNNVEYLKIDVFIEGMNNKAIQERLEKKRAKIKTLSQAIDKAEDRESYLERRGVKIEGKEDSTVAPAIKVTIGGKEYDGEVEEKGSRNNQDASRKAEWSKQGGGYGSELTCYKCGGKGHFARDCVTGGGNEMRCFRCNGLGHRQNECVATECYACGGFGHRSFECPRKGGNVQNGGRGGRGGRGRGGGGYRGNRGGGRGDRGRGGYYNSRGGGYFGGGRDGDSDGKDAKKEKKKEKDKKVAPVMEKGKEKEKESN